MVWGRSWWCRPVGMLVLCFTADAHAQGTPGPDASATGSETAPQATSKAVTLPQPIVTPIEYPPHASGEASVVLELVVDARGIVTSATLVSGTSPFYEAALAATASWRFEPARRDGQPVAAKILYRVLFAREQSSVPASPTEIEVLESDSTDARQDIAQITEVIVTDKRPTGTTYVMGAAEARQLPGGFGDPTRSIEVMPGVAPLVSGLPLFFVRGAPPGNVGFFIDGIRVPLLYHGFFGPSVIHPALIERVELYPGGYPAEYGRYSGAIVAADTARPIGEFHGEANVRLLDAGALVEAPFAGGSAIVGGRYSYTGLILSLLSDARVDYWDYQALASVPVGKEQSLGLFAFGASDFAGDDTGENFAGTEFHRADFRYDRRLTLGKLRLAVTLGHDRTRASQGFVESKQISGRAALSKQLSDSVLLKTGADVRVEAFELDASPFSTDFDDLRRLFPERTDTVLGSYVEFTWRPTERVGVTPGLRADLYRSLGDTAIGIDPRIAARFEINPKLRILHNFGIAHQVPNFVPNVPGAQVAGLSGGLQRGVQVSSGVEVDLPHSVTGQASVFRTAVFNLSDPISISQNLALDAENAEVRSTGDAAGLELQLRRPLLDGWGGLVSYTLSSATRRYQRIHSPASYDRPHVLTAAVSYDLGRRWLLGVKGVFYSGVPGSRVDNQSGLVFDQSRAKPFFRADLRIEKRWSLGSTGYWAFVGEMLNATASTEVIKRTCSEQLGCRDTEVGPIFLPSVGIEAHF